MTTMTDRFTRTGVATLVIRAADEMTMETRVTNVSFD